MKSIVRYCSDCDYMSLFHLSSLLTELNFERAQLIGSNKYFFSELLPPDTGTESEDASSISTFFDYDSPGEPCQNERSSSDSDCHRFLDRFRSSKASSDRNQKCFNVNHLDQTKLDLYIFSRLIRNESDESAKKYDAAKFCKDLRRLMSNCDRFGVQEKLELLKNLSRSLLHYVVQRSGLQQHDHQCSYEMLFNIIDEFGLIDIDFVLYLVTDLNMSIYFFGYLFDLSQAEIGLVLNKYIALFDRVFANQNTAVLRSEQFPEFIYSKGQIFQLNVTFSICLIKKMFQSRDCKETVVEHGENLLKLIESLKNAATTNDVSIGSMIFHNLRLYNFVLEQLLNGVIEVGSKQVGLITKKIPNNQLKSIFVRPLSVLKDESLLSVFNDCSKTITLLIDANLFRDRCTDALTKSEHDFVQMAQHNNQELVGAWNCVKKFFSNCDISFEVYEFIKDEPDSGSAVYRGYVHDYIENERPGYLFLIYALVQNEDHRKIQQLIAQTNLELLVNPKTCYIFAYMAFLKQEKTSFYAEVLKKLIVRLREPEVLRAYVNLHFKQFHFKQLEAINLHQKREFFNKADAKCADKLREELIKSVLLDPLQTMYHLISIPLLSNRNLLSHICDLLYKEFYSLCTFKLTVDVYEVSFLTSLIHNKMQSLDYAELEWLCYFVKYLAFVTSSNGIHDLVEIENLILITILNDNLADVDLLKKKIYFLHTLFDLNDIFKTKFKRFNDKMAPLIIYMVQCLDRFWLDVRSKVYTLKILRKLTAMFAVKFSGKREAWARCKLSTLENRIVAFYISELFEDELIGDINKDRLTDLLFLCAIDEKYNFGPELEKHKSSDGALRKSTIELIRSFVRDHLQVFTPKEHVNLFSFLVDHMPLADLMIEYINTSIRLRLVDGIEAINQIVKSTFFKRSKLHEFAKADSEYAKQFKQFYDSINEVQNTIFEFYDEPKFANFLIELKKFCEQY